MKEWTADSEYTRGKREIMLETTMKDLRVVCSRIEIMESDLDGARKKEMGTGSQNQTD